MAFFGLGSKAEKRMANLETRGQLAVDRAEEAARAAHRMALGEARIRRENEQYNDRLTDRKNA